MLCKLDEASLEDGNGRERRLVKSITGRPFYSDRLRSDRIFFNHCALLSLIKTLASCLLVLSILDRVVKKLQARDSGC